MNYPYVNREICGYCGTCVSACPKDAIDLIDLHLTINKSKCVGCLACVKVCPISALKAENKENIDEINVDFRSYDLSKCKQLSYDVVVIGAGPGGSMSAKSSAENGVSVLMIEKRQEIGSPVRCAEGVSWKALAELVDIDPKWVCAEIHATRIYSPDGSHVTLEKPQSGLVLERKIFDKYLAMQAVQSGADVWTKARAIDLIKENGRIAGVIIRKLDGDYAVKAKVVIAADGVESQVGRWAGIKTFCKPVDLDTCVQYLMTGIDINPNRCDFYLGHHVAPRGYVWVFPKGKNTANVGIGIGGNIDTQNAIYYLNKFIEKNFKGASFVASVFGGVPVSGTLSEIVLDNFMIVGDAAHQNDPVSGGGIINAMIAGNIAGEVSAQAIKEGNTSRAFLIEYEKRWHKQIGRMFGHLRGIRDGVMRFNDDSLNNLAKVLAESNNLSFLELFWKALKSEPRLLLELRHLISMGWAQW
jgi:digeranylgeranylglycerophospholipid reductase